MFHSLLTINIVETWYDMRCLYDIFLLYASEKYTCKFKQKSSETLCICLYMQFLDIVTTITERSRTVESVVVDDSRLAEEVQRLYQGHAVKYYSRLFL